MIVRTLPSGLVVRSAHRHLGEARRLVHELKYRRGLWAAERLATAMVPLLPPGPVVLVPVPRAPWRRLVYGIDPAVELAAGLGGRRDVEVLGLLRPGLHWRSHAGRSRLRRGSPPFRAVGAWPPRPIVLVDDVVTTGVTLEAAAVALGRRPVLAVTATAAGTIDPDRRGSRRARAGARDPRTSDCPPSAGASRRERRNA